jgi:CRISPR-associated Csx3 family protein
MDEKKLIPGQSPEHEGGVPELAPADRLQELYDGLTPEDKVLFPSSKTLSLVWLATALWLQPEKVTLPNGKEIMSIVWKPEHLPKVFELITKSEQKNLLGKNDVVTIDGVCPTWLLPTISHALHPVSTSVTYPQWWPDAKLPLSGAEAAGEGMAEGVKFTVIEDEEKTSVSFELTDASIDVIKAMQTLVAPEVTAGKPVFISGRGPIAIATALAEAYAHRVPFVACFQPGTGRVVCISHSDTQLGTIFA